MNPKKPSRRKGSASKLEPIDWREFANDAVLNGNMSTLYRRPPAEDASAYASPEAMVEIEKRVPKPASEIPTVGPQPSVDLAPPKGIEPPECLAPTVVFAPAVGLEPSVGAGLTEGTTPATGIQPTEALQPTVGIVPAVGRQPSVSTEPTEGIEPAPGVEPTEALQPTVGIAPAVGVVLSKKVRPLRTVEDALTLAGQVLYRAMLAGADSPSASCTKGYRQLAAETHLDKDTVRDLIVEFKKKGILRETATYDPDTRLSKTYEVLAPQAVLQAWHEAGIRYVTTGRQRPVFCSAAGEGLIFTPTVGRLTRQQ